MESTFDGLIFLWMECFRNRPDRHSTTNSRLRRLPSSIHHDYYNLYCSQRVSDATSLSFTMADMSSGGEMLSNYVSDRRPLDVSSFATASTSSIKGCSFGGDFHRQQRQSGLRTGGSCHDPSF